MITQLYLDLYQNSQRGRLASKGTPVGVLADEPDGVFIKLPDGQELKVAAGFVSSGVHSPEETLSALAEMSGVLEDTLLKAAQSGRLMARKSGAAWLSTLNAVEWAIADGKIRQ